MTVDQLKLALDQLKTTLSSVEQDQKSSDESCQALVAKIENYLRYPDADAEIDTLIDNAKTQLQRFEVEHPKLTEVISQVITILNNMGV